LFIKSQNKNFLKILKAILGLTLPLSLILGAVFIPITSAKASFISVLLGNNASASNDPNGNTIGLPQAGANSQTIGILAATVSPASVLNNKQNDTQASFPADTDNIVADNSLQPEVGPLGVSDGTAPDAADPSTLETSVYVVRSGDSIATIAAMYGVSVNTVMWANDLKKGDKLKEGDVIVILPVSGVEHTVTKGQTLKGIADLYKADVNDIIQANDISVDAPLVVGDTLMIPDGQKSEENDKPISANNLAASAAKDNQYYATHPTKKLSGYFINPVPGYRLSQGIHDKNAVDLAIATGTPIHAAAAGVVTFAKMGWNGAFGNLVIIKHANGTETLYAHQSRIATSVGAHVSQGEVIGYVGSTGHSTGPHLHFEVHGARNPGADGSWAH
jgi:LysM repeat protein